MAIPSLSPSRFPGLLLRGWALVDGLAGTVVASSGIAGLAVESTGVYVVTLSAPMSQVTCAVDLSIVGQAALPQNGAAKSRTASVVEVRTFQGPAIGDGPYACKSFHVAIYA